MINTFASKRKKKTILVDKSKQADDGGSKHVNNQKVRIDSDYKATKRLILTRDNIIK